MLNGFFKKMEQSYLDKIEETRAKSVTKRKLNPEKLAYLLIKQKNEFPRVNNIEMEEYKLSTMSERI